jgi:hypothetical protein
VRPWVLAVLVNPGKLAREDFIERMSEKRSGVDFTLANQILQEGCAPELKDVLRD